MSKKYVSEKERDEMTIHVSLMAVETCAEYMRKNPNHMNETYLQMNGRERVRGKGNFNNAEHV